MEFLALMLFFSFFRRLKIIDRAYPAKRVFAMSFVSNVITILLGVSLFFVTY